VRGIVILLIEILKTTQTSWRKRGSASRICDSDQ